MNYSKISNSTDKIIGMTFIILFVASSVFAINHFRNDNVQKCEKAVKTIARHLESILEYKETKLDDKGTLMTHKLFDNKNINLNLLNSEFAKIEESREGFFSSDGSHSTRNKNNLFRCYKTGFFFIYATKLNRAWINKDFATAKELYEQVTNIERDEVFITWLRGNVDNKGISDYDKLRSSFEYKDKFLHVTQLHFEIDRDQAVIEEFQRNLKKRRSTSYLINKNNRLVEITNKKVEELNKYIEEEDDIWHKEWYNSFMDLVEVSLIWPEQESMDME